MDTGLHQAVIEWSLNSNGPAESETAMVLGGMVGAIDTYWVLSAMVLKYGELNKKALQEAKSYMKEIDEIMCPDFEKKVSVGLEAKVTVFKIEDCYEKSLENGDGKKRLV